MLPYRLQECLKEVVHALDGADALLGHALGVEAPERSFGVPQLHVADTLQLKG